MATPNQRKLRELARNIAYALDLPFVHGTRDEELSDAQKRTRQATHVLFRDHADGSVTLSACGLLPSIWRERPTKALVALFSGYLDAIGATRQADRMRANRLRDAIEAANSALLGRGAKPQDNAEGRADG